MTREPFVQRMSDATLGAFDVASPYLGLKLGFYRSLAEDGPATAAELAGRTGTDERLVREWRFALPEGHVAVLLDPDGLDGIAGTMLVAGR